MSTSDTPAPDDILEWVRSLGPDGLTDRMGIQIVEASRERLVATMPVEGNTQPMGLLHGGAHAVLAETLGSIGASVHGWPDRYAVGIELNCTHHRSADRGVVTGTAVPLSSGRTLSTWEVVMTDERGRRLCTARLTCLLRELPEPATLPGQP